MQKIEINSTVADLDGEKVPFLVLPAVKLRRPNKTAKRFKLKDVFGFIPDEIIIQLERSRSNSFHLIAVDRRGESLQGKTLLEATKKENVSKTKKKTTKE